MNGYRDATVIDNNQKIKQDLLVDGRAIVNEHIARYNIPEGVSEKCSWLTNIAITGPGLLEDEDLKQYVQEDGTIDSQQFIYGLNEALNGLDIDGLKIYLAQAIIIQEGVLYPVSSDNFFGLYGQVSKEYNTQINEIIDMILGSYECINKFDKTEIKGKVPQNGIINILEEDISHTPHWVIAAKYNQQYMKKQTIYEIFALSNLSEILCSTISISHNSQSR
ncbi:MAG: hypothetical protein K0B07_01135 [DPANN group archaeon]|nr:hypothetical protein [DPANN group archaeon]